MSASHTPGPWAVSKQKARRVTASGVIICNAVLRNRGGPKHTAELKDEHEAEANACLIATAPDLLAALETAMQWIRAWDVGFLFDEEWTADEAKIMAAIAKARGAA